MHADCSRVRLQSLLGWSLSWLACAALLGGISGLPVHLGSLKAPSSQMQKRLAVEGESPEEAEENAEEEKNDGLTETQPSVLVSHHELGELSGVPIPRDMRSKYRCQSLRGPPVLKS